MEDYRAESYKKRAEQQAREGGYYRSSTEPRQLYSAGNVTTDSPTAKVLTTEGFKLVDPISIPVTSAPAPVPGVNAPGTNPFTQTNAAYVSGSIAQRMARESSQPQSIRGDVNYLIRTERGKRDKYLLQSPEGNQNVNNASNSSNANSSSFSSVPLGWNTLRSKPSQGFAKRVEASEERQKQFLESEGFKNINELANWATFGKGAPIEKRSFTGQTAQIVTSGLLSWPIALGGTFPIVGEKIAAIGEGTYRNSKDTFNEMFKNAPKRWEAGPFNWLPGGTPINAEGAATVTTAAIFAGVGYPSFKNNPLTRTTLETVYPSKFVKQADTGIKFVEDYTEPTKLNQLLKLEGEQASTIHVTTSNPFKIPIMQRLTEAKGFLYSLRSESGEFLTVARTGGAGEFRAQNLLLNFYKSSPEPGTGTARAYLGYAGIIGKDAKAPSSGKVIIGKPTIRLITFEDTITPTPKSVVSQGMLNINAYQAKTTGKTFVPAENFFGSKEGQVVTPSSYTDIPAAKQFGLEGSPGSIIKRAGDSQFTFYRQAPDNSGLAVLKPFKAIRNTFNEITGKNYYKLELIKAETRPALLNDIKGAGEGKINALDIGKYNESYGSTRYVNPSRLASSYPAGLRFRSPASSSRSSSSLPSSTSSMASSSIPSSSVSSIPSSSVSSSITPSSVTPSYAGKSFSSSVSGRSSVPRSSVVPSSGVPSSSVPQSYGREGGDIIGLSKPRKIPPVYRGMAQGTFNVLVRRGGKFNIMNRNPVDFMKARSIGEYLTRSTAARSFKIVPTSPSGTQQVNDLLARPGNRYYAKNGILIEKSKFAINTRGEFNEISRAGQRAQRRARSKGLTIF